MSSSGLPLALASVAALAAASAWRRRGSRSNKDPLRDLLRVLSAYAGESLEGKAGREAEAELRGAGLEIVGSGGARLVVALGPDLVAKVDFEPSASANNAERDFYRWNKDNTNLLNPVLSAHLDGRVLVMPRAERVFDDGAPPALVDDLEEAKQEIAELPYAWDRVDHTYDFNWGLVGGALRLLDYNT